jgi:hypothetical protein
MLYFSVRTKIKIQKSRLAGWFSTEVDARVVGSGLCWSANWIGAHSIGNQAAAGIGWTKGWNLIIFLTFKLHTILFWDIFWCATFGYLYFL